MWIPDNKASLSREKLVRPSADDYFSNVDIHLVWYSVSCTDVQYTLYSTASACILVYKLLWSRTNSITYKQNPTFDSPLLELSCSLIILNSSFGIPLYSVHWLVNIIQKFGYAAKFIFNKKEFNQFQKILEEQILREVSTGREA